MDAELDAAWCDLVAKSQGGPQASTGLGESGYWQRYSESLWSESATDDRPATSEPSSVQTHNLTVASTPPKFYGLPAHLIAVPGR